MRIDVRELELGPLALKGEIPQAELGFDPSEIQILAQIQIDLTAERQTLEVRIRGRLTTDVRLPCSRCLEPARIEIARPFDLFFRQHDEMVFDEDDEIELTEEDTQTAFFTGTKLAIGDVLHEQLLLALPMKPLCRLDCKGLCPQCGTNLNLKSCDCAKEQFNSNLDALLEIKRRLENRSS